MIKFVENTVIASVEKLLKATGDLKIILKCCYYGVRGVLNHCLRGCLWGKKGPSDDSSVDLIRLNLLKNDKKLFDVNTLLTIEVQTNILIFQFNSEVKLCWTQK